MAKPYKLLRDKMSLEARKKSDLLTEKMIHEMPLYELRKARLLSQEEIAKSLHVNQAAISKMERRADMYISTLRSFIKALGGDLEITARFPDGNVKINLFEELSDSSEERSAIRISPA